MGENQNRILLAVTIAVVLIGGITIWVQRQAKSRKPVIGWYNLGTETFDLKPGAHRGYSYREVPATFRIEAHSSAPIAFGFVTPDAFGHFTSTIMEISFPSLPCGTAPTMSVDLNCKTQPDKRYLLITDTREDTVPEPARKGAKSPVISTASADNHVTVTMYDWRCISHCENLPKTQDQ
jgi:hypothetical protein